MMMMIMMMTMMTMLMILMMLLMMLMMMLMLMLMMMLMIKTLHDDNAATQLRLSLGNKNTRDDRVPCQYSPDDSRGLMMTESTR